MQYPQGPVLCPNCQNQARIAQAIYSAGTVQIEGATYHSGTVYNQNRQSDYSGRGSLYATSQSDLAKVLAPPFAPEHPSAWGCSPFLLIGGSLIFAGIVGSLFASPNAPQASQLIGILLALSTFIGSTAWIIVATTNKQKELDILYAPKDALYRITFQRWQEMYYCSFDHGLFLKSERNWVPADQKDSLLFPPLAS